MAETQTPSFEVDVTVLDPRWGQAIPDVKAILRRATLAALGVEASLPPHGEISLALVDDAEIRRLNHAYRQKDQPTNVLSFPGDALAAGEASAAGEAGPPVMLGDVVVAFETAVAEARAAEKSLADHLCHLVVHGVLHLLGYDHMEAAAADEMEALECNVLDGLGISDPYAIAAGSLRIEGME